MSDPGALLFARYAYPPNELGYCGPAGAAALLRSDLPGEIARRARHFEGAWAYLEYLSGVGSAISGAGSAASGAGSAVSRAGTAVSGAGSAVSRGGSAVSGAGDPLDAAVVEAYWVGNALLDSGDFSDLPAFLGTRFVGQHGGTWEAAAGRAIPHHSFHVFEVYPWAALLRRTGNPTAVSVLDRCRIRTGKVCSVRAETATVTCRPLVWNGSALAPGPVREEEVAWSAGGRSLLDGLAPGDRVALHWDWLCDVITDEQAGRIESLEETRLGLMFPEK